MVTGSERFIIKHPCPPPLPNFINRKENPTKIFVPKKTVQQTIFLSQKGHPHLPVINILQYPSPGKKMEE